MTILPFATLFTHQRLKENYLQYLKQSYQQAPFSFLLDVREYRENPSLESAKTIALKYISDNFSALEINIDKFTKDAVLQAINQDSVEPTVFDEAYKLVYFELKSDSFQRYLHSELFQTFQKNRLSSETYVEVEHKNQNRTLSDFSLPRITDEDITTFTNLTESSVDYWRTVRRTRIGEREKQYYTYVTKVKWHIDGICNEQIMAKCTGHLEFSAKDALHALLDAELQIQWNNLLRKFKVIKYDNSGDYDVVQSYNQVDIAFFLRRRHCYGVATVVYDFKRKCYMWCCKTSTGVEEDPSIHGKKRLVRMVSAACYTIYEVGENKCRYSFVGSADVNIKQNETLLIAVTKKRGKAMHEEWQKLCQYRKMKYNSERPMAHNQNLDTLDSFFKRYGTKTWVADEE